MVHIVQRHPRGLGLDEEFGAVVYAEVIIRPEGCFRGKFNDHVAFMRGFVGLVLDVPAEGLEERIKKIDTDLGLIVVFGKVVMLVLLELFD